MTKFYVKVLVNLVMESTDTGIGEDQCGSGKDRSWSDKSLLYDNCVKM